MDTFLFSRHFLFGICMKPTIHIHELELRLTKVPPRRLLYWSLYTFPQKTFKAFSKVCTLQQNACRQSVRCYKLGYCLKQYTILDIRRNRDMKLWRRISSTNTTLSDLLPPQRTRQMRTSSHNYILPNDQTSRFKSVFINRCLFNSN